MTTSINVPNEFQSDNQLTRQPTWILKSLFVWACNYFFPIPIQSSRLFSVDSSIIQASQSIQSLGQIQIQPSSSIVRLLVQLIYIVPQKV